MRTEMVSTMKRSLVSFMLILSLLVALPAPSVAQAAAPQALSGVKSVCPSGCDYATLTAAISDIGAQGGLSGPLTLELAPTYVSTAESYPLTFGPVVGSSTVNTLTVRPAVGATGLVISANVATATVDLNGAKYLAFDGRPGGVGTAKELTIENTNTSGAAVRFINDASYDTLQYLTIKGVSTGVSQGVVAFSTTTGTTGNDNNTVDHCDIRDGATTPAVAIYSSGTSAKENSGITISNNNIYNFYSGTGYSYGMDIYTYSTGWTVTGNSFYQTASRANVASSVYVIYVYDGTGYTISNNYIGGSAPSAGGTPWTVSIPATAVAYRFVGIYFYPNSTSTGVIQNNVIGNFDWKSSSGAATFPGVWCGIYDQTGHLTISNNTIGGSSTPVMVSASTTGATDLGIASGSSGTTIISGNTISSITAVGITATGAASTSVSHSIKGIAATSGTNTITNNTIGSTTTANSINAISASTNGTGQLVTGIESSSTTSAVIATNTVANLNNNYAGTGSTGQVRGIATSGGVNTITNNTIRNLSNSSQSTGSGSTSAVVGISQTSIVAGQSILQNTIHTLSATATTTAATVTGIFYSGPTTGTNVIGRNLLHSFGLSTSSSSGALVGLYINSGNGTVQNNMVRLGIDAAGGSLTPGYAISGILYSTGTFDFYHNTAYVGGTGVTSVSHTYAFNAAQTLVTRNFKNNIWVNNRSNASGTGVNGAAYIAGTLPNPSLLYSDYNLYYANGTGGALIRNGTTSYDFAGGASDWRTANSYAQDVNSFTIDPNLVNAIGDAANVDLHVASPTPAEQTGVGIGSITDDFDGQARASFTPVDLGADAGNFTQTDAFAPSISYTLLANTASTANRSFTGVSITDYTGVNTSSGTAPRVYYKRSTDGNVWNDNTSSTDGWKWVEANGVTSPFDFTLDYSRLNGGTGVTSGVVVQYFVVAQDTASTVHVRINSGSFAAAPTSVALTGAAFPIGGLINQYTILQSISGIKTICTSGCDYTSLTNAGGLFDVINAGVVAGNITAKIQSDLTAETGTISLNQWIEEGGSNFTLTIQPDGGAARLVSGGAAILINLNGADRVTFDGLNSDGNALTIRNTTSSGATIRLINDASNNIVRNCTIESATTGTSVFLSTGTTTGNDNNTITKNTIRDRSDAAGVPTYLVYSSGSSATIANGGNVVSENALYNFTGYGVYVVATGNENWTINKNTIYQTAARTTALYGISFAAAGTNQIAENTIRDLNTSSTQYGLYLSDARATTIARNRIYLATAGSTSAWYGVYFTGSSGNPAAITLTNNMIALVPTSTNAQTLIGVYDYGYSGNTTTLYHNTVYIGGTASGSATYAFQRGSSSPTTEILKNNIFFNNRTGGSVGHFANGDNTTTGPITADYNLFAGTGVTANQFMERSSVAKTFAQWQTETAGDAHSIGNTAAAIGAAALFVDPVNGDYHIHATNLVPVEGVGVVIPAVTDDYDGQTRSALSPTDIGADAGNFYTTVSFIYHDLEDVVLTGEEVYLAGDFTSWGTSPLLMAADGGLTTFTATVALQAGSSHEYKYFVRSGGSDYWEYLQTNNRVQTISAVNHDYRNVVVGWANLQWPYTIAIDLGASTPNIFGQVYINNVTNPAGEGRGIKAEVGYGTGSNPATWTWYPMTFNTQSGNNDEFGGSFTPPAAGVFSYATRFDGNWGSGNPNAAWAYGDKTGSPFDIADVGALTVTAVNYAPVLDPIGNKSVNELQQLTFTAAATDSNGGDVLTYSLDAGAPAGANIGGTSGIFTWTPTEAEGPGVYTLTVRVTDNGSPVKDDFEQIEITVNEVNAAPVLGVIGNKTVNELEELTFTAATTDSDLPANTLTYSLDAGAPAGANIGATSGIFSWTPTEAEGPGVYTLTVRVTDNGSPVLDDFEQIVVTVNDVNSAPVLGAIGSKVVDEYQLLTFTATATDSDIPANTLAYSLEPGAPAGASIDPVSGVFTWTPAGGTGPAVYTITITVTDNGLPVATDAETIEITVNDVLYPPLDVTDLDLLQTTTPPAGPWAAVPGSYAGGFTMMLDPTVPWYYLDTDVITVNRPLADNYYPFYITAHPAGFFAYWASLGVVEGAGGWQGQMWEIINGRQPIFYLKVTGTDYMLVDGLTYQLGGVDTPLKINGTYLLGAYTFSGVVEDEYDVTDTVSVNINFVAPFDLTDLDLLESTNLTTWTAVSGSYAAGFTMGLDPTVPWYYLDTNTITANRAVGNGYYYPFFVAAHPAGYFAYWAGLGVVEGAGGWQGQMWEIINGRQPIFYLKVAGTDYMLVDGLTYQLGGVDTPLKINGSYLTGAYTFSGVVADAYSYTDTVNVDITFNEIPVANGQSVTTDEDIAKAITLTASDAESDPLTWMVLASPAHGALSGTAPNLTYTPALNYNGPDSFTFKVNDGISDSHIATVTITVDPVNDAPVANGQSLTTAEDTALGITLTASDIESDPLTWTIVVSPAHGALSGTAPNLTYTPALNYNGPDSFTFKVNDGLLDSNIATINLTVDPVNDAPVANGQSVTTNEDTAKAITLTASDIESNPLTWTIVVSPAHGALSGTAPNLTYTPALNYNGPDSFTFKVNDGLLDSNTATVTITVSPVNDAPVANGQSLTTAEDTALGITLTASDIESNPLTWIIVASPAHGALSGTAPNLTYTPALNYNGPDSFTFKVNDGLLDSNTATINLTVNPVNDAPVANGQSLTTAEDTALGITLTASDIESNPLTWIIVASPAHGALSGTAPNLTYTPALNYNGPDSFTFKVNDGLLDSNIATVNITVTPVNDNPNAVDDAYVTDEDVVLVVAAPGVLLNDVDVDGDSMIVTLLTAPTHGKVIMLQNGSFTYSPDQDFHGTDSFTYRLVTYPAKAWIDDATVTITINPVNDAPVASVIADVEWLARVAHSYAITAFTDVDGDTLSYSATANGAALPAWLNINPATGEFSGTPTNEDVGVYAIVVTGSDGHGGTATAAFTLTVTLNPFSIFLPIISR